MKILVSVKRVADPDNANKIRVTGDGRQFDTSGLSETTNPFDEYALEAALRLTEDGRAPKERLGEVVVATLGPASSDATLRAALAMGADRGTRVEATDEALDGALVASALAALVRREQPDLVLLGKQAVDGDSNQVGQRLAELLDWPQATFAAVVKEEQDNALLVGRELDGGVGWLRLRLPAVVTVDLRIVTGRGVLSKHTPLDFSYRDGVRFTALPAIMKAKRKPLNLLQLNELVDAPGPSTSCLHREIPPKRPGGRRVGSVSELVDCLVQDKKVLA